MATVISTASQIQMENGSHSAALLIMYGTDRATRLWTTGGPSHVPIAFWLCAGDYPCVLVIYKAPLFSSRQAGPQNVPPFSSIRDGLSQLCPFSSKIVFKTRSYHKKGTSKLVPNCKLYM